MPCHHKDRNQKLTLPGSKGSLLIFKLKLNEEIESGLLKAKLLIKETQTSLDSGAPPP